MLVNWGVEDIEVDGLSEDIEVEGVSEDIEVGAAWEGIEVEGMVDDIKVDEVVEVDGGGVEVGASHSTSAPWARLTSWKQYSALSSCLR